MIGLFKVQSKKYKEQSRNRLRRWLREMIFVTKSAGRLSCEATTSDYRLATSDYRLSSADSENTQTDSRIPFGKNLKQCPQ